MKYLLLLAIGLGLSGCAKNSILVHDTKNHIGLQQDSVNCEVKANQAGYTTDNPVGRHYFIKRCLGGEGWREVKN